MERLFEVGQYYMRSDIHAKYGGNSQTGISYPASKFPYIFLFDVQYKGRHVYEDGWVNSNVFSYTGEGRIGDMRFERGNLVLRDQLKTGKRIFLFSQKAKGAPVRFESELEFLEFGFVSLPDEKGNLRQAIKFFLKRKSAVIEYNFDFDRTTQESIPEYKNSEVPNETERKGLVISRVGQGAYRKSILYRWEFKCAVTKYTKPEILIASHIMPWKIANNEERLDVENGILLSPTYDALFDQHLISFDNKGKIVLSKLLNSHKNDVIGLTGKERIDNLSGGNIKYLERHQNMLSQLESRNSI
ncbi:HNH endonuclease [Pollutibacter soli]|uniref:HNH endonuclease n=1 Tax=Pollutibacter soli TaxID=3034157 RepID=UPI003013D3EC